MLIQRMSGVVALLLLFGSVSAQAAAFPQAVAPLQPNGKWTVDFGDAHCIAMRNYGTDAAPVMLAFKPSPIGDVMHVSVVRPSKKKDINQYPGSLTVDAARPMMVSVLGYPAKAGATRIASVNLSLDDFRPIRAATAMRLRSGLEFDRNFALTQMTPVTNALDRCVTGLRKLWNIGDAANTIREEAQPEKSLVSYFSSDDYPSVAVHEDATGTVQMMTLIDETGKIASCMVIGTSGYASLDAQSCAIITVRAKFRPAVDTAGKPAKSGLVSRIRWMLPED